MFKVREKSPFGEDHNVYAVKEENGILYLLIYYKGWKWVEAEQYVPYYDTHPSLSDKWREVIRYCVEKNLNPELVLEVLTTSIEIAEKMKKQEVNESC